MNDPEMTDLGRNFKGVPGFKRKHNIQKIKDLKRNKIKKTTATKYNIPNKKKMSGFIRLDTIEEKMSKFKDIVN